MSITGPVEPTANHQGLPTTAVVGAGPSGLVLARAFLAAGLPVEVFERHHSIGGIWAFDNPGTPMYESAHFISSKTLSGFPGFPMPDEYPDYPSHRQILAYLHDFADAYGLERVIHTGTEVQSAAWVDGRWQLTVGAGERRTFDHLVCANGATWDPNRPDIPGDFDGELLHSVDYRSADDFRGKRVLVIGAGNSGVDIACDAAAAAAKATISMRRGYHIIPKHILGQPADVFAESGPDLPVRVGQTVFGGLLRLLMGKPSRYGLPAPDHRLFETHPILNTRIYHHLSHGDLDVARDVERFDGSTVHFVDGTTADYDIVICATGYKNTIPYLDPAHFEWRMDRPQLYLHVFHRTNPQLHALGFTEGDGAGYTVFDNTAVAIAELVRMLHEQPARRQEWLAHVNRDRPELRGGVDFVDTARHVNYLHVKDYLKLLAKLSKRFGWTPADPDRYDTLRAGRARAAVGTIGE
ncbi:MAG: NAD(P)/FAD-dependent oxidoreductase [Actinomycetota bacterium]